MHINRLLSSFWFILLLFLCLGTIIYSNTFNSSFHLDDTDSIVENYSLRDIGRISKIWSFCPTHFITYLSLAVNYRLGQLNVLGYHIFNMIIHIFSAVLVWWLVLITFSAPGMQDDRIRKCREKFSLFAGLVFLAHPIQTQAVTYIIQRSASMATLFYIGSLCLYAKARLETRYNTIYYISSLVVMVLAMFSKEISITIPLIILLYEYYFLKQQTGICWKKVVPFLLCILIIPLTMLFTKTVGRIGEEGRNISAFYYFLTQFRVKITFMRLLLIPVNQNLDYDYPVYRTLFNMPTAASVIVLIVILIIAVRIFRSYKLISFSIFWFYITLLTESSIIPIRDVIFEHRLYLPMVGFLIFLVCIIYYFIGYKRAPIILLVVISIYSVMTYRRNFVWRDDLTLWEDVVKKSPYKARAYSSLGNAYSSIGMKEKAIELRKKAIEVDPSFSHAYYNLANTYSEMGRIDEAISMYKKAIEVSPDLANAYINLGNIYSDLGKIEEAIVLYQEALKISPDDAATYNNLGTLYKELNKKDEAIDCFEKAIEINSSLVEAYNNLCILYKDSGEIEKAVNLYKKAIKTQPFNPDLYLKLGVIYHSMGNIDEAMDLYKKALEINPDLAEACNNLAVVYYKQNNYALAVKYCDKAIALGYKVHPGFLKALEEKR